MKKAIKMILAFSIVFGAGYYFEAIKQTFQTVDPSEVEERAQKETMDIQQEFQAAKSKFLDINEKARVELEDTLHQLEEKLIHLRKTTTMKGAETSQALFADVMEKITHLRQSLADGQKAAAQTLRDAQEKLDALLGRVR